MKWRKVTQDRLETRAFITGKLIQFDNRLGVATCDIGGVRFYADLPATPEWVAPVAAEGGAA